MMEVPTSVSFTTARGRRMLIPYMRLPDRNETPAAADIKWIIKEVVRGFCSSVGLSLTFKECIASPRLHAATGSTNAFSYLARSMPTWSRWARSASGRLRPASHFDRQRIFTRAHRLAGRLSVKARCCICFAKNLGVPYRSGRWWYRCQLLGRN